MNSKATVDHPTALSLRLGNIAASVLFVALACGVYATAPYNRPHLAHEYRAFGAPFTGTSFLVWAAALYVAALVAYYLLEKGPAVGKSLRCLRVILSLLRSPAAVWRAGLSREDRLAVLATLLKGFFAPFMAVALMQHVISALANGWGLFSGPTGHLSALELFNRYGFLLALKVIFFVDVAIFTVGYLVESRRLNNEIRSVDPTLLGWAAALLCYPPFNLVTGKIFGGTATEFPHFDNPTAHVALNVALLLFMAIYASASVAMGLKASNLTHRGIIDRGPYRFVRHPAYAAKNMAWCIGSFPVVDAAFTDSWFAGISAVGSVLAWTMLYALRAVTEEDHLRSVDGEYAAYAARVRYRFVPGVY